MRCRKTASHAGPAPQGRAHHGVGDDRGSEERAGAADGDVQGSGRARTSSLNCRRDSQISQLGLVEVHAPPSVRAPAIYPNRASKSSSGGASGGSRGCLLPRSLSEKD